jgi:hypothetical protein
MLQVLCNPYQPQASKQNSLPYQIQHLPWLKLPRLPQAWRRRPRRLSCSGLLRKLGK